MDFHENDLATRQTQEVIQDHIRMRLSGDLEEDLRCNYAPDAVLLTENSSMQGHDAFRVSAAKLYKQVPGGSYEIVSLQVLGDYGLLVWRAQSDNFSVDFGADTFVVINGKIRMHTVHYHLVP